MPSLTFKRAKCDESIVAKRRIWKSHCGRYRVEEFQTKGGYYAEFLRGGCWETISLHFQRPAAERSCQRHARIELTLIEA